MNLRRLTYMVFSFLMAIGISFFTFKEIVKRDSTVNQPSLIEMTDLGYENSETTNAIVREFYDNSYSGIMYSLKISTKTDKETIGLHLDLFKCESHAADEFYREILTNAYHSARELSACGAKDNCHIPKLSYEKTISQLFEMDSASLHADLAYAFNDPLSFDSNHQNNELYILKDSLVLRVEPWGMDHPFTALQLAELMRIFDQAHLVFNE